MHRPSEELRHLWDRQAIDVSKDQGGPLVGGQPRQHLDAQLGFDLDGGAYRAVTPHAGGVSSTPQLPGSVTDASGLLDHPHAGDDERDWTGAGEKVRSAS